MKSATSPSGTARDRVDFDLEPVVHLQNEGVEPDLRGLRHREDPLAQRGKRTAAGAIDRRVDGAIERHRQAQRALAGAGERLQDFDARDRPVIEARHQRLAEGKAPLARRPGAMAERHRQGLGEVADHREGVGMHRRAVREGRVEREIRAPRP
ncbi:MAG: hypothetical protein JKP98_16120 [Rhodobacteraceae bacterium]|nr:hypothetical protein [Paracoccaceae bacterium]